jgi:hypothetical protein
LTADSVLKSELNTPAAAKPHRRAARTRTR